MVEVGLDHLPCDGAGFAEFGGGGVAELMSLLAAVSPLPQQLAVSEVLQATPIRVKAEGSTSADTLPVAKSLSEGVADLVEAHEFDCGIVYGAVVAIEQRGGHGVVAVLSGALSSFLNCLDPFGS